MSNEIAKLFDDAQSLLAQHRLLPGLAKLERAQQQTTISQLSAFATYNIGVSQWARIGNGVAARNAFLSAAAQFDKHGYGREPKLRLCHAAALENAMLCALSFDEFDALAARLRVLTPEMPILAGLVPVVHEARERGDPWSRMLLTIALPYYNRNDPKLDAGRYGEAKSTYHLLIANRRTIRLKREFWRLAVQELCPLSLRMASDCLKARGGDLDKYPAEEYLSIVSDAIPLVDEYLATNSGDSTISDSRNQMSKFVGALGRPRAQTAYIKPQLPPKRAENRRPSADFGRAAVVLTFFPLVASIATIVCAFLPIPTQYFNFVPLAVALCVGMGSVQRLKALQHIQELNELRNERENIMLPSVLKYLESQLAYKQAIAGVTVFASLSWFWLSFSLACVWALKRYVF